MNKIFSLASLAFLLYSCGSKQQADLIVHNAVIYTVDSSFSVKEAMALKDGKILAAGTDEEILNSYSAKEKRDAERRFIFPGFIDAHCHFYGYGKSLKELDLAGTTSFDEVLEKVKAYAAQTKTEWVTGRGWDQNDWLNKEFPDRRKLDSLFPDRPVLLKRVDGHAALANGEALKRARITPDTKISGGEIQKLAAFKSKNSAESLSGILIDNAVDLVSDIIPAPTAAEIKSFLLAAQNNCFEYGLTTVDDAGLDKNIVDAIDALQKTAQLKMRVYAMLTPNRENLDHFIKTGIYKTGRLNVRSFKFYADGALGSRGAYLFEEYHDKKDWRGFLLSDTGYFKKHFALMREKGFQCNTHCIGEKAVSIMLDYYHSLLDKDKSDGRWRIEHAQTLREKDFKRFGKNIIPSVQPTHATSDMYWAEERLGKERLKFAYAYRHLLQDAGIIALGTDFPVEDISTFKTFYAAVFRKDAKGFPEQGFQMENALSREDAIRGMTLWAAYSNFEEKEKGSIEPGKYADFVILDTDLLKAEENRILSAKVLSTFIGGEEVYKK